MTTTWLKRELTQQERKRLWIAVIAWVLSLIVHLLSLTVIQEAQMIAQGYLNGEFQLTLIVNTVVLVLTAALIVCGYLFKGKQKYFDSAFIVSTYISGMVFAPTLGIYLLVVLRIP